MNDVYYINWDGGEVSIFQLGCMMVPKFKIDGKLIEPLHTPDWVNDKSDQFNSLPGILKNLRGEFPCVPFGINSAVDEINDQWKSAYSTDPYIVNEPHGFSANNNWELVELTDTKAELTIKYPEGDNVDYLISTIEVDINDPNTIKCSLQIAVKKDCVLPIGFHPMINIPSEKNMIKIIPGKFKFGLTYPGLVLSNKTAGAIGKEFNSIERIPGFNGKDFNLSSPPYDENYEDLFQLCGIDGRMTIENYKENYRFLYQWNPSHFSSVLVWLSNKGRTEYPWNSKHITIGLEPITSAFGLSTHMSCNHNNPINSRGVSTMVNFFADKLWKSEYQFSIEKIT